MFVMGCVWHTDVIVIEAKIQNEETTRTNLT